MISRHGFSDGVKGKSYFAVYMTIDELPDAE